MLKIKKLLLNLILWITISQIFISSSYAYLDPGTGSIILQMLAAIIAAILAFWQYIKIKIKNIFNKFNNSKNENKKKKELFIC